MTAPEFDELAAACPHCRCPSGQRCVTSSLGLARRTHAPRIALSLAIAAHADPLLDAFWAHRPGCWLCEGTGRDARYRRIEAVTERMAAGESPEEVQADYQFVTLEAVLAVRAWAERWPGATG